MNVKAKEFNGVLQSVKQGALKAHSNNEPWKIDELREGYKGFNQYLAAIMPMRIDVPIEKASLGGVTSYHCQIRTGGQRTIFYIHGGYYLLDINALSNAYLSFACELAASCDADVWAVDYAVAPENPYPASINDVYKAYLALVKEKGTADNIYLIGDSVGGGMVLALQMKLRDEGQPLPKASICVSALTDMAGTGNTMVSKADEDPVIVPAMLRAVRPSIVSEAHINDPYISPLYGDFNSLPPLMMMVGENEVLYDDTIRAVEKAKASGVHVALNVEKNMVHIYPLFSGIYDEGKAAIERIAGYVKSQK